MPDLPNLNIKPSPIKRFNTKDILNYFIDLLDPSKKIKARLQIARLSSELGQAKELIDDPSLKTAIETLRKKLGPTPARNTEGFKLSTQLTPLENNDLIQLNSKQVELQDTWILLKSLHDKIFKADQPSDFQISNLDVQLKRLVEDKLKNYQAEQARLKTIIEPLEASAAKLGLQAQASPSPQPENAPPQQKNPT